jgi:hypothetical protein
MYLTEYTVHSTQHTAHNTQYTAHSTQYTAHSTLYTVHSTQHTAHSTQYTLHSTQYTAGYQTMSAVNRTKFFKISRSKIVGRSTDHIINYTYVFINIFYMISANSQHGSVENRVFSLYDNWKIAKLTFMSIS